MKQEPTALLGSASAHLDRTWADISEAARQTSSKEIAEKLVELKTETLSLNQKILHILEKAKSAQAQRKTKE